jgi:predicted transposase/invertase (TIGR01784 family)
MPLLNPRVDFAFKKLFGAEENKDILISFINAVVAKENQITEVILLNPYNLKNYAGDKLSILDIKATDEHGRQYNIEMQITDQVSYTQRALYYWAKLYSSQLQEGDAFGELKKTISINILNFNCFEEETTYHNVYKILNMESHRSYFEDLEIHFIELNKFDEKAMLLKTTLDRWTNFLKKAQGYDKDTLPVELKEIPAIEKAMLSLNTLSLNKEEREVYEARLKWLRDEAGAIEKAHEKGIEKGIEKGTLATEKMVLKRQLIKRFGSIPSHYLEKIENSGTKKLLLFIDNIVEAKTIEAIFEPQT